MLTEVEGLGERWGERERERERKLLVHVERVIQFSLLTDRYCAVAKH